MVVNNVTTYHYVEVDGEVYETPFQALEMVSVDTSCCEGREEA